MPFSFLRRFFPPGAGARYFPAWLRGRKPVAMRVWGNICGYFCQYSPAVPCTVFQYFKYFLYFAVGNRCFMRVPRRGNVLGIFSRGTMSTEYFSSIPAARLPQALPLWHPPSPHSRQLVRLRSAPARRPFRGCRASFRPPQRKKKSSLRCPEDNDEPVV